MQVVVGDAHRLPRIELPVDAQDGAAVSNGLVGPPLPEAQVGQPARDVELVLVDEQPGGARAGRAQELESISSIERAKDQSTAESTSSP